MSVLLTLGLILLAAVALHGLAPLLRLPRVTLLMLFGVVVGPLALDLLPAESSSWFEVTTDLALTLIGFLLGGEFSLAALREHGARPVVLSLGLAVGTAAVVTAGLMLVGLPLPVALVLGGIAPATDPAATVAVLDEVGARGSFAATVRSIVALDDVWGLLVFSGAVALATTVAGQGEPWAELGAAAWDLGVSVALGGVLGGLAAPVTGRLRPGQPILLEAVGLVLVCAGAAAMLGVSPLLAAVVMGAGLTHAATHHEMAFRDIEDLEWPVLVVFFVLAGASLRLDGLATAGVVLGAYVVLRVVGRFVGLGGASLMVWERRPGDRTWLPLALLPQGGLALGLTLAAAEALPSAGEVIVPVIVAGTLIFEIGGPPLTRLAALRVGDSLPEDPG